MAPQLVMSVATISAILCSLYVGDDTNPTIAVPVALVLFVAQWRSPKTQHGAIIFVTFVVWGIGFVVAQISSGAYSLVLFVLQGAAVGVLTRYAPNRFVFPAAAVVALGIFAISGSIGAAALKVLAFVSGIPIGVSSWRVLDASSAALASSQGYFRDFAGAVGGFVGPYVTLMFVFSLFYANAYKYDTESFHYSVVAEAPRETDSQPEQQEIKSTKPRPTSKPNPEYGDWLYFSIVTGTTLGYGEIRPLEALPKVLVSVHALLGVAWLVIGFAAVSYQGAQVAEARARGKRAKAALRYLGIRRTRR